MKTDINPVPLILLIDDDVIFRIYIEEQIKSQSKFNVVTAESATHATEFIEKYNDEIVVILTDLYMPSQHIMSPDAGLDFLYEIDHKISYYISAIAISVMCDEWAMKKFVNSCGRHVIPYTYIVKPFGMKELGEIINKAVKTTLDIRDGKSIQQKPRIISGSIMESL
jgi:DNA-binding NtrC family response regulator